MNLLILKGFNNYFNRIIKKYGTTADYISNSDSYYDFSDINFNPNDGVTTTQIIGSENQKQTGDVDLVPLAWEHEGNPDYLIAYETEQVGIATVNVIKSRWFIVESVRTRNGQYSLKLKRDSIADHLDTLLTCPAFIKKGTVSDDNPLVVNSEGITVSQIKSGETLLKDKTNSAWIVGYMAKNAPAATITEQIPTETFTDYVTIEDIATELGISSFDLSNVLTENTNNPSYFANSIETSALLNYVDQSSTEWKLAGASSNLDTGYTSGYLTTIWHPNVSDCVAKIHLAGSADAPHVLERHGDAVDIFKQILNTYKSQIKSSWSIITNGHPYFSKNVLNALNQLKTSETIIYKNGKYYKIKANNQTTNTVTYEVSQATTPFDSITSELISDWNDRFSANTSHLSLLNSGKYFFKLSETSINFYLEEVSVGDQVPGITVTMSTTRNAIMDQPYDMFAIPATNTKIVDNGNEYDVYGEYAQKAAMALVKSLTSANVYDVQLLPYCPIPEMAGDGEIDISNFNSAYDYDWLDYTGPYIEHHRKNVITNTWTYVSENTYRATVSADTGAANVSDIDDWDIALITAIPDAVTSKTVSPGLSGVRIIYTFTVTSDTTPTTTILGYLWWNLNMTGTVHRSIIIYPKSNSFSVDLDYNLSLKDSMKIDSQTDLYRLVSPNYQGSFDFNVAKNGGAVNGFVADCTYKPYTPYIKVAPNFGWLYGTNYGDCRGLICGGDFSIGIINSAWEQYQLQNKNYQNIFNREIQNLDVSQSIQRTQQYVSGGLNIARDTIAGGVGGGLATGSPYGAIAGAVVGGIGSGIGYGLDMSLMEKGLQEQRQFSIDKYKMQLGNVQALPYTLTKVGAFTINSKIWPFLEYYTCSAQEKEALKMKIQYEGMTLGIVDYLGSYMTGGYVQADLIRNESIIEDSHLLDDIYIELTKGVYM